MSIEIQYTEDNIGINFCAVGHATGTEIIEAMKEVFHSNNFLKLRYWIVDRSICTKYEVSSDEAWQIANLDKEAAIINPNLLMVFISETKGQYAMSKMYEIYSEKAGFKTMMFRDRATAEKWIKDELNKLRFF